MENPVLHLIPVLQPIPALCPLTASALFSPYPPFIKNYFRSFLRPCLFEDKIFQEYSDNGARNIIKFNVRNIQECRKFYELHFYK